MAGKIIDRRYGGTHRAHTAREEMSKIFSDTNHPLYCIKEIELSRMFSVTRLTIYRILDELKVPPRTDRILKKLKTIDTKEYTRKELSEYTGVKYMNLYKILRAHKVLAKPDIPPIETMRKAQEERRSLDGDLISDIATK
jgi:predicted transcriptional regulator